MELPMGIEFKQHEGWDLMQRTVLQQLQNQTRICTHVHMHLRKNAKCNGETFIIDLLLLPLLAAGCETRY